METKSEMLTTKTEPEILTLVVTTKGRAAGGLARIASSCSCTCTCCGEVKLL